MQDRFFAPLREVISNERLEAYRRTASDTDPDLLGRYQWNIALSEALYPVLNILEIALRNSIHQAIRQAFNNQLWMDMRPALLDPREQEKVIAAKQELQRQRKPPAPGRLIAELNFGFWTSLFDARYEQRLWPRLLKDTFPTLPSRLRTRRTLSRRLNDIRYLRNRIFHHEPIWHLKDLGQRHGAILEAIYWISPTLRNMIQPIDRFPEVYRNGSTAYRTLLVAFMREQGYSV
jgi:hypothetical protein